MSIKGISIEINGNVTPLQKALKSVNVESRALQQELREVEKYLKLDPSSTEALSQKQRLLAQSLENTSEKLNTLKKAQENNDKSVKSGTITTEQYKKNLNDLDKQISKTETQQKTAQKTLEKNYKAMENASKSSLNYKVQLSDLDKNLDKINSRLKDTNSALKLDPKNLELVINKTRDLKNSSDITAEKIKVLKDEQKKLADELGKDFRTNEKYNKLQNELIKTETQFKNLSKNASESAENLEEITKATDKLDDKLKKNPFEKGNESLKKFNKSAIAVGLSISAIASKTGIDLDSALAKVSTLFGDTIVDTDNLRKKIFDLASATGFTATELSEGLYEALSSGVEVSGDMSEALNFLESSTKLARGGFTTIKGSVDATTSIMNTYGISLDEAKKVTDQLIMTQNKGKTTVDELKDSIADVAPVASNLGVSFEEVAASLSTMTASGTPTTKTVTQLNAAITSFTKPNKVMVKGLQSTIDEFVKNGKITGKNAEIYADLSKKLTVTNNKINENKSAIAQGSDNSKELAKTNIELLRTSDELGQSISDVSAEFGVTILESVGLQGALELLSTGLEGSENQMVQALGSNEAYKASMQLTGEQSAVFVENLNAITNSAGSAEQASAKMADTTEVKLKKSWENFKKVLEPIYKNVIIPLIDQLEKFSKWATENGPVISAILTSIAVAFVGWNVATIIDTVVKSIKSWKLATDGLSLANTLLNLVLNANPLTLIITLLSAVAGAVVYAYQKFEWFRNAVEAIWKTIRGFFSTIGNFFSSAKKTIEVDGRINYTRSFDDSKGFNEYFYEIPNYGYNKTVDLYNSATLNFERGTASLNTSNYSSTSNNNNIFNINVDGNINEDKTIKKIAEKINRELGKKMKKR